MNIIKKHQFLIISVITLFCFSFSGCIETFQDIIIDDNYYQNAPRDPFVFNRIKLVGSNFFINVSYGGGCEEHEFVLIATSFMESYPVQVNVLLSHEDNDDPCDAWITEEMAFNISPLKKAWQEQYNKISGTIMINLDGWEEQITYDF